MLRILNEEEGFDIKERELMRVRAKNRWLLRVPNGMKSQKPESSPDLVEQLQQAIYEEEPPEEDAETASEPKPVAVGYVQVHPTGKVSPVQC
jgi:hypothetical protein